MPTPSPSSMTCTITTGSAHIQAVRCISAPVARKYSQKITYMAAWMAKLIKLVSTWLMGMVRRGKYTLPNTWLLATKVLAVLLMQLAKKVHTVLPAM